MPARCTRLIPTMTLGNREREISGLLADGMNTKAIARLLDISESTARKTIENAIAKLSWKGVYCRAQLVRWVMEQREAA